MRKHNSKPMGCSKSSSQREVCSNTILPRETREKSNRESGFTPKANGKRTTTTTNQYKERNHKDLSRNKSKRNERNNSKD